MTLEEVQRAAEWLERMADIMQTTRMTDDAACPACGCFMHDGGCYNHECPGEKAQP